jgi:sigma-B regulation protein RsbU (phosphoserine phosphatase)
VSAVLAATDQASATQSDLEALTYCLSASHDLGTAGDLKSGLRRIADGLRRLVSYETLGVLLLDDRGQELSFAFAVGYPPGVADHWRFGLGQGIVGSVAASGHAIRVADTSRDPRYIDADQTSVSELAVPLIVKGRVIGVLDIGSRSSDHFSEQHERIVTLLAGHLAAAIDTARLYRSLKRQTEILSAMQQVGRELTSILDRETLLNNLARIVRRLVDYDLFTLLLWDEQRHLLQPALVVRADGVATGQPEPRRLGQGLCGTAAALRQPIRTPNTDLDPRYESCTGSDFPIRSELSVPLIFKDRLLGVLDLGSRDYAAFSAEHEQTLSTLGASLAIGLENARLYESLRREEASLANELATARELQRQLLPKATPWVAGLQVYVASETAWQLGGDFYDFLEGRDRTVAFAVGDVSGKGASAALYGALAAGTLREYFAGADLCPGRVLADMNERLFQLDVGNRFLAMAFATFERHRRVLTISNSGLPHPFLLSGGEVSRLPVEGAPLGLFSDREYAEISLPLNPGDAVVLLSDGIEDATNGRDEEFGPARAAEVLRRLANGNAEAIATGLLRAVDSFVGPDRSPSDDCTVLVLKHA